MASPPDFGGVAVWGLIGGNENGEWGKVKRFLSPPPHHFADCPPHISGRLGIIHFHKAGSEEFLPLSERRR